MEDTLVQDQSLGHQAGLGELNIRIPAYPWLAIHLLPGSVGSQRFFHTKSGDRGIEWGKDD